MAKIYISSTFTDLREYREAVYKMLRRLEHDVISMEDYVATDQRPLAKCLADVAACDVYIGIIAWRYGYIPDRDNLEHRSITELEYRKAAELGKPCLVFLLDENKPWPRNADDKVTGEGERGLRIEALRKELATERLASFFDTPDMLAGLVSAAIQRWEAGLRAAREARERQEALTQELVAAHPHVISYSPIDAEALAIALARGLEAGTPALPAWIEQRDLAPGQDRYDTIAEAIRACDSLLVLISRESMADPDLKDDWVRALRYKKPVIPILLHHDADARAQLADRRPIDFTGAFAPALAQLRARLQALSTPAGALQALQDRLADAQRSLRRATNTAQRARIQADIAQLDQDIADQQRVIADPSGAAAQVEERIAAGLERERQPQQPPAGVSSTRFINPPPASAPAYFQDRYEETRLVGMFLQDESIRLISIVGRGGIGKTAMVCRLLKGLERGQLPDDTRSLSVDGIVYLSNLGSRRVNLHTLYADLCKLLPDSTAARLDVLYKNPQASTTVKMEALLAQFSSGRTIVLLDNFEDVIDQQTFAIRDAELNEALHALLHAPQHAIKVILTSRVAPRALLLEQPGKQRRLDLDEGLPSPYAENILRAMDADGKAGLRDAPEALLAEARERTRGYPRALEALFAILSADRDTTLSDILSDTAGLLPENVIRDLVGEAYCRLDPIARQVLQALAVYNRPVSPTPVDYLLQPYLPGANSAPVLNRLVNMQFARREGRRYYLHPVDRAYAFERIPEGSEADREAEQPSFSRFALLHRGAEYFKQARTPEESWKTIEDLRPQLIEFELRYAGRDYDAAAEVLLDFDFDYLLLWGHYRPMAEMHERLQGKINDSQLKQWSIGNLGTAYRRMGQFQRAIDCYQQALACARAMQDRPGEDVWLGNLGRAYADLGQIAKAMRCYERALEIDREVDDRNGEWIDLYNLGNSYLALGETDRATAYYEQSLKIAREIEDLNGEEANLGKLGSCYAILGQTDRALDYHQRALVVARGLRTRNGMAKHLANLALGLIDQQRYAEAIQRASESVNTADEMNSPHRSNQSAHSLALAQLYAGNLPAARTAAEVARKHDDPENNHNVLALLGLIALLHGDGITAHESFAAAMRRANTLLAHTPQLYNALDAKGLALCGLALIEGNQHLPAAIEAYRAARAINKDAGAVARVLRLFDALAVADAGGMLAGVRAAAGGE